MSVPHRTRRRLLHAAGGIALLSLAGCTQDGGTGEEVPEGVSQEEFDNGPVPEPYRTALSQANERRDPEALVAKDDANFQEADETVAAGDAEEGQTCESCAEFIPDKNGDGFGACAKVEGYIGADDWCALWESIEEAEG